MATLYDAVVVVSGGAGGIGSHICRTFSEKGSLVFCIDRRSATMMEWDKKYRHINCIAADISRSNECERVVRQIINAYDRIDVLVNTAGYQSASSAVLAHELEEREWEKMMAVNVKGVWLMCKHVLPFMIAQGGGHIINMGSVTALRGPKCMAAYAASKAAVHGLTRALAAEYAKYGIMVNTVAPGTVDTRLFRNTAMAQAQGAETPDEAAEMVASAYPIGRLITPQEVADAVVFLTESSGITGITFPVDGGVTEAKAPWTVE